MYSLNPAVTEMLTTDRLAEIQRQATQCRRPRRASGRTRSLRRAMGWALVEMGLRLAVPHRTVVARRSIASRSIDRQSIDRRSIDRRSIDRRSIARQSIARQSIDRRQSALPVAR